MRILMVHNRYRQPGGEDAVADAEAALLEKAGHEVERFEASNNSIDGPMAKARTFHRVPYNRAVRAEFAQAIKRFRPDIVHVHNYFPLVSPSIFFECRDAGVPVVHTLHNFRPICMNGLLLREGRICEKCVGRSPWHGVLHRCYRDSVPGSIAVARMITRQRRTGWADTVSRFIALSEFARRKFIEGGLPAERIVVKPNFVADDPGPRICKGDYFLYAGRLSREKGVEKLIEAWRRAQTGCVLKIAGAGPEEAGLRMRYGGQPGLEFLGWRPMAELHRLMGRAIATCLPSSCYENMPRTIVESYAVATPVIALRQGPMPELVTHGVHGLLASPRDRGDLVNVLGFAARNPGKMARKGREARAAFERHYTAEANCKRLLEIYRDAQGERLS